MTHTSIEGVSDFCTLRRKKHHYVDKTDFIEKFCECHSSASLFTRPGRLGKSLHLSMPRSFFDIVKKDATDCFAGLKVSRNKSICNEWMHQHPVLHLDFKALQAADSFPAAIKLAASSCAKKHRTKTAARPSWSRETRTGSAISGQSRLPPSSRTGRQPTGAGPPSRQPSRQP